MEPASQPGDEEVGGRYSKYVLGVLIVVYVFNFIDRQILSILAEEIKADLGISDADIGFLYGTAFAVFYAVFGIPLGRMADVWVRKSLISLGLAFWSLMTALSGTARSFLALAVYRFGVGVGEASATPAAFSMLSDYFPPRVRATVLAIYSSGIYIGAGIGLFLGGAIVDGWNALYPDPASAPLGLKAWQVAFFAVGFPGLVMAVWVWTLREPRRGQSEGIVTPEHPHPFRETGRALAAVLPPFTVFALYREGGVRAVRGNLLAAALIAAGAYAANAATATPTQWIALGIGIYSAVSWVQNLTLSDPATFGMMFRSKAFVLATIGFPSISFVTYGVGFWSPPFMVRVHDVSLSEAGLFLGGGAALGGWLGITVGGILADRLRSYTQDARVYIGIAVPVLATPFALGFLYAPDPWLAYLCSFGFSIFSPMWIGAAASTVNDLVMPRMRALASAYYVLMNTFVGLALGPYLIGQISDGYIGQGWDQGDALRQAMVWGLGMLLLSLGFLFASLRYLRRDEDSRLERARSFGEPV
ncbi:MAG: MFS transporter [Pseudomonadales bacterium]